MSRSAPLLPTPATACTPVLAWRPSSSAPPPLQQQRKTHSGSSNAAGFSFGFQYRLTKLKQQATCRAESMPCVAHVSHWQGQCCRSETRCVWAWAVSGDVCEEWMWTAASTNTVSTRGACGAEAGVEWRGRWGWCGGEWWEVEEEDRFFGGSVVWAVVDCFESY